MPSILLVEDSESDVELTRRALRKNQIRNPVVVARDGEAALALLLGGGPAASVKPGLILLDLKLPKVDGVEVLRRIRQDPKTRRLPVVVLTSSNESRDLADCYDNGANSYVRKPVDFAEFNALIGRLGTYWLTVNEKPPSFDE